ncbi:hypothetical protein KIN_26430 [Litoreibacter roseus]|uniref:Uncharacterized protein n=2 Tax=Litoreibacter roseus TaxID=2601869 RepID=A0A6N6JJF8_9RHOB|nr:hypothetical protein KIN_26430 [Litoreibacter roseus]
MLLDTSHSSAQSFDVEKLAERLPPQVLEKFQFEDNGELISGPVRARGEPIDYSELLDVELLKSGFLDSIYSCVEGIHYCDQTIFRQSSKSLPLKVISEDGIFDLDAAELVHEAILRTLATLGFEVPAEADENKSRITLYIGSIDYLQDKTKAQSDRYGFEHFERLQKNRPISLVGQLLDRFQIEEPDDYRSCYVSTRERAELDRITIYLEPNDLDICLAHSLMYSLGFGATGANLPTVTNVSGRFQAATLLDFMFVEWLYDEEFPTSSGIVPIKEFLEHSQSSVNRN